MTNQMIRIYSKPKELGPPASIIGFSISAVPGREQTQVLQDYFNNLGHTTHVLRPDEDPDEVIFDDPQYDQRIIKLLGGISSRYIEISPPVTNGELLGLGELCSKLIDPGNDYAYLVDNRKTVIPIQPYSTEGNIVAMW